MTLSDADLREMLFALQAAIDSGLEVNIKNEAIKAMAEELLAARAYFKKQEEYVEKIRVGLEELNKHDFSDYGSSGMPAKINGEEK